MLTRHALSIFFVAGLLAGCGREQPGVGSGSARHADPGDPDGILQAGRDAMKLALEKGAEFQALRSKQVDKLDRQVERIQRLLDAGKLDEAEVLLVDIHWVPVEPGKKVEADFTRIYDDKRTSLAQLVQSRRPRVP